MLWTEENGIWNNTDDKMIQGMRSIGIYGFDKLEWLETQFGIDCHIFEESSQHRTVKFESHDNIDFLSFTLLDYQNPLSPLDRVCIYLRSDLLLIVSDAVPEISTVVLSLLDKHKNLTFGEVIEAFLDFFTRQDFTYLEKLEQKIENLEDSSLTSLRNTTVLNIIALRKKLMLLKRHYEQMLGIFDDLLENQNGFIDKRTERKLKILLNRIERLYHSTLNLHDYITQVREAYQSQVDIDLNRTMKIFTVLTAIFLPLTLIVGWYGMNLQMPEFGWKMGYPFVIGLSVAVVAVTIFIFRKRKWF